MTTELQVLADNRDALLLAEVAAWLHNIGKLDPNFIEGAIPDKLKVDGYRFQRFVAPELIEFPEYLRSILLQQSESLDSEIDSWIHNNGLPEKLGSVLKTIADFMHKRGPLYIPYAPCRRWVQEARQKERIKEYVEARIRQDIVEWKQQYPDGWRHLERRKRAEYQREREQQLQQRWDQVLKQEQNRADEREKIWLSLPLHISSLSNSWSLGELLTLFWDDFFEKAGRQNGNASYEPGGDDDPDYTREYLLKYVNPNFAEGLPSLLILSHGEISGQEKAGLTAEGVYRLRYEGGDKEGEERKELEKNQPENFQRYTLTNLRLSTAFGYEQSARLKWESWIPKRLALIKLVPRIWRSPLTSLDRFIASIAALQLGVSDSRLPFNEISLFDYSAPIAALFKTAIAQAILTDEMPTPATMRWRLASIRLDAFNFLFQANQVADLVARRRLLAEAYRVVAHLLEIEFPIASQVYSDEHGLVVVLPEWPEVTAKQLEDELSSHILKALEDTTRLTTLSSPLALYGAADVRPIVTVGPAVRGKKLNLQAVLSAPLVESTPSPEQIARWWSDVSEDRCTVCGLRPVGYMEPGLPHFVTREKAKERQVCGVCLARRGRRAEEWAKSWQQEQAGETIWIDEVADINGRFALIVGQFDLDDWLNGALVRSLAIGTDEKGNWLAKPPTFARIFRIWRTTKQFWEELQAKTLSDLQDDRRRLKIHLDREPDLGQYHVYDMDLGPTSLSVAWIPPQDGQPGYLVSTDNLQHTARQLGAPTEISTDSALSAIFVEDFIKREWIDGWREPKLHNPEGAASGRQSNLLRGYTLTSTRHQDAAYAPVISILAEPRTFMALVPANKALDVVRAIKTKYEREMGKVRNRLPLHLGVVYAHRRMPLRAVLDAGRRMLNIRMDARTWEVDQETWPSSLSSSSPSLASLRPTRQVPKPDRLPLLRLMCAPTSTKKTTRQFDKWRRIVLKRREHGFEQSLTWYVPAVMGDGQAEDHWYPYVFLASPDEPTGRNRYYRTDAGNPWNPQHPWLVHAGELRPGDEVYFTPATFDFIWLDAGGRRFEVAYDEQGRRRGLPRRPYLLDELETLDEIWETLRKCLINNNQIYALNELIEKRREEWPAQADEPTFRQFCRDALANAAWRSRPWNNDREAWLDRWADYALRGWLADVVELRMAIMKEDAITESTPQETAQ